MATHDCTRSPDLQAAYDALDPDEQAFAAIIESMLSKTQPPYRGMAEAGLALLACAADGIGLDLADDATNEEKAKYIEGRVWHMGYGIGFARGHEAALDAIKALLNETQPAEAEQHEGGA